MHTYHGYKKKQPVPAASSVHKKKEESTGKKEVIPVPLIETRGQPVQLEAIGGGSASISLHGTTQANFDGGSGTTTNLRTTPARNCDGCSDDECVTVSGTFVLTCRANPVINLPRRSEYAHLRPCQIQRVEQWIQQVLLPHEQDHARAFNTYSGVVSEPFSMKICRSQWSPALLDPIHERLENARRQSAQQLSDALDPFHTNIDLDCEDEETEEE